MWTADTSTRRVMAHYKGHAHLDFDLWGREVLLRLGDGINSRSTWLEWGAGGGAVATAITRAFEPALYYAVDLADLSDSECARLDHVRTLRPADTARIPDASVDYVVSTACFQHFPSAEYGRAVLRELRRIASPGARGLIQTRYYIPGDPYDPRTTQRLPYAQGYTQYMAWRIEMFGQELADAGFLLDRVDLEPERPQAAWYRFLREG